MVFDKRYLIIILIGYIFTEIELEKQDSLVTKLRLLSKLSISNFISYNNLIDKQNILHFSLSFLQILNILEAKHIICCVYNTSEYFAWWIRRMF